MSSAELRTVTSVAAAAAELFIASSKQSVAQSGRFNVVLSGGSTPLTMYEYLVKASGIPWDKTVVFWGDERFVPFEHPDSNYGTAKKALLEAVAIPGKQIHPWPYLAQKPQAAARQYAHTIRTVLGPKPKFDLIFLGLGEDAHTASLFPDSKIIEATDMTVVSQIRSSGAIRLSLNAETLSLGRVVAFLVSGEKKREALVQTLHGPRDPKRYPAQAITAKEQLIWLTDLEL